MKSIFLFGTMAVLAIAVTIASLGLDLAQSQIADNATLGNMTMNMGNTTDGSDSISGVEDPGF